MRLLLDDTFATSTFTVPIVARWVTPAEGLDVSLVQGLTAAQIDRGDAALVPAAAIVALTQSHLVEPRIAVIAAGSGAVAMRTPVRPDEVTTTPVRLYDAHGAELLARALLRPFYGIEPTIWIRDDDASEAMQAQVVIVEGAEALREPEGGYSEDLSRAWFIWTAMAVVSHVLLIPRESAPAERKSLIEVLSAAKQEGLARRREWRTALAEREGVARDRAGAFWAAQRLELDEESRQALRELLKRGSRQGPIPFTTQIPFADGADRP